MISLSDLGTLHKDFDSLFQKIESLRKEAFEALIASNNYDLDLINRKYDIMRKLYKDFWQDFEDLENKLQDVNKQEENKLLGR